MRNFWKPRIYTRRTLCAFALAVTYLASAAPSHAITTETLLDSYRTALAARKTPAFMEFEYTVTRSGPSRIRTEQHRVYWTSTGLERNDTIAVNGTPIVPARSSSLRRSVWPYDVGQFAVSSDLYNATANGVTSIGGRKAYVFTLTRATQADFMLTSLYLDANRRLPLRQTFAVSGADCQGSGSIDFLPSGGFWLPNFVSVVCTGAPQGASPPPVFKEAIRFGAYSFPTTIPSDVFGRATPSAASPSSDLSP